MRRLRAWFYRLGGLFGKARREGDLSAELEGHLQLHIDDNLQRGMSPAQARREALMKLGGIEQTKENYRGRRGLPWLEVFFQDLRFGARMLRKNPGFTLVAVLTLALGISANATIFSLVNAVLYKKPAVHDPGTVLVVYGTTTKQLWGQNLNPVSSPNYFNWKRSNQVFTGMAAGDPYYNVNLTGDGEPERAATMRVTANYFSVLGVSPELGRTFAVGEDQAGHDHVVVLSHQLWERRFGSNASIVGKNVRLNGEPYTVIGVMPQSFRLMSFQAQLWLPLVLNKSQQSAASRETRDLFLFARLKPGMSLEQARANMRTLGKLAAQNFPDTENGWGANCLTLQEYMVRDFNAGPALVILLTAVGFVLLIACANIGGLLLARATGRGKEMAVRIAIGARRMRVVRQLMTEALLIALLGAVAGLALTLAGERIMHSVLSFNEEVKTLELQIDWRVVGFTTAISMLSALLFGLVPALKAWSVDVFTTLKNDSTTVSSGRKKNRLRSVLVAGEVTLAVVLLSSAGIFVKEIVEEMHKGLGFEPQHLLTAQITLPDSRYKEPSRQLEFYRELTARLDSISGASAAAITSTLPGTGPGEITFRLKEQENLPPGERAHARYFAVSPHYFETTQTPLIAGRQFSETDDAKAPPVVMVSEKFVERFFPKGGALGKLVLIDSAGPLGRQWRQIVGVVRNVKSWPGQYADDPEVYEPLMQHPAADIALIVRARGDADGLAPGLRKAVWAVDKDQPIGSVLSLREILNLESAGDRVMGGLMGTFAVLALALSGIGLYGVGAYTVGQRSQEIGIRVALGANRSSILRMVLRDGLKLALLGAAVGTACALPLPRAFGSLFNDFHVSGGWIFVFVPVVIVCVATLACYIPARRASRVDPIIALRYG
ncbi:MAG: ABC transporter permease [Candidatus Acidiferrum sp.]